MNNDRPSFSDGSVIELIDLLMAREQRVIRQSQLIKKYRLPVVSFTPVIPGNIKNSSGTQYLFTLGIDALKQKLHRLGLVIKQIEFADHGSGFSALCVVDCAPLLLKDICMQLENDEQLGRLWDFDVIDAMTQRSLSRGDFNIAARQCLICGDSAKNCARSARHTIDELRQAMQVKIINTQYR